MLHVQDGQCGLCAHFGEHHNGEQHVVQIRTKQEAPEELTEDCLHPRHAPLNLRVTAVSGCDGYVPARADA